MPMPATRFPRLAKRLLITAVVAAALGALPATGLAATFTVTTHDDLASPTCPSATDCSLRGAAEAATDGDTIVLGAGTYAVTLGDIVVEHGLNFVGAGVAATTIDASGSAGSHRVLKIRGFSPRPTFLRDLAITGGRYVAAGSNEGGGAIANNSVTPLYLTRVRVYGNTADLAGGNTGDLASGYYLGGGGIRSQGSVYLTDSSVDHNALSVSGAVRMSGGGGVYVAPGNGHGDLVMTGSTIAGNVASITGSQPDPDPDPQLYGTTYPSNHGGGGAYVAGEDLMLTDSSITGNAVTVDNAYAESGGGGAFVEAGDLTATRSTISGNTATVTNTTDPLRPSSNEGGGGIYMNGHDVTIVDSTVAGNALTVYGIAFDALLSENQNATNGGGAIYQFGNRLSITGSTLSGNSAAVPASERSGGGAIIDDGYAESITNSTLAGNSTTVGAHAGGGPPETNGGGAILLIGTRAGAQYANVTLAGNAAPNAAGGGLMSDTTQGTNWPVVQDSIIAANTSGEPATANCFDPAIISQGYNLADDAANSCGFTSTGDQIAAPQLGPLQDNGGPTQTMALAPTSPAVHAGNPAGCAATVGPTVKVDQRGVTRPQPAGTRCDIGAYELAPAQAKTSSATILGDRGAILAGTAGNPDAKPGTEHFEYGTTTKYGKRTADVAIAALTTDSARSATLAELKAGTYHYRLAVTNAVGTVYGADRTFTVPALTIVRLSTSPTAVTTRVRVSGAGTITQKIVRGSHAACTARAKVKKASTITLVCKFNAKTRSAIRARSQNLQVTTTFTSADHAVWHVPSVISIQRFTGNASPVTG